MEKSHKTKGSRTGHGEVQKLNSRHFTIIDRCLRGKTVAEIAKELGMHPRTISIIIKSPQFQHELGMRREEINEIANVDIATDNDEVAETLKKAGLDAARKLIGGLDSEDESIKFKSATDILDRTGYPKFTKQVGNSVATIVLDDKAAKLIVESLKMDEEL